MNQEIKRIETEIIKHFKDDSLFIYTFGSIATEKKFNRESDIDFAIYLKNIPTNFSILDYARDFYLEMEREVDIVILNKADIIITMQVLTNGKLLYTSDDRFRISYQAGKTSEYIEFKESRKLLEKKLIEK